MPADRKQALSPPGPTFAELASRWFEEGQLEWRQKTQLEHGQIERNPARGRRRRVRGGRPPQVWLDRAEQIQALLDAAAILDESAAKHGGRNHRGGLRHTFASILIAIGVDPGSVMEQLGHADPGFTLRVYRHGMRRDRQARARLAALVGITNATGS